MKVLVTGANGLLGHHVVLQLLDKGHDVKVIVRSLRNIYFNLNRVEITEGEFANYETLKSAASTCEAIIHIAATTSTHLLQYKDYKEINVDGSKKIINVANELNIDRLIFISTANTIGYGIQQCLSDEESPIQFPFSNSFYAQSKVEAEQLFIEASKKPNRHVIIINPTFMIGAYDTKPSSGKLMLMGYKKPILFTPKGGKNFVAVTDVATAIYNALTKGQNGERYLTSGENLSFKQFYQMQSNVAKYSQKIILLPCFVLKFIGKIGDLIRFLGIKTEICTMNLNQLTVQEYYNNQKGKTELGMPQSSLKVAISDALSWFKENNKI